MTTRAEYVIVGAGLTGGTIARLLHDAGRRVVVVDRRAHVGGNVFDHVHATGVRVHTYGPHLFRTSSDRVWAFVNRFASFYPYRHRVLSEVDGVRYVWPPGATTIRRLVGDDWRPEFAATPTNFEEAALSLMPRRVFEMFVKEYNEKQWGVPAAALDAALCRRFDVRADDDPFFTPRAKHQALPVGGFAALTRALLDGIDVRTGVDWLRARDAFAAERLLVFTGPIDEYFDHAQGRLHYRGQERRHDVVDAPGDALAQEISVLNNPTHRGGPHVRTIEWKHFMRADERAATTGSVLTTETPRTPTDPDGYEYPFPDDANRRLYESYRARAAAEHGVLFCGRLGEYRYFDMDQAIARATMIAERILLGGDPRDVTRGEVSTTH